MSSNKNKNNNSSECDKGCCSHEDTAGDVELGATKNKNNNNNSDANNKPNQPMPVSTQLDALSQYHAVLSQQQHQHQHQHRPCCHQHAGPARMPVVGFQMPPADYVRQQPVENILGAMTLLTKMGRYGTLMELHTAWQDFAGKAVVHETLERLAPQPTREGHTLLHWAAKRTEDLRFVQLWLPYIDPLTKTTDNTGMTPLHWACTEPESFPIIQYMLTYQPPISEGGTTTSNNSSSASSPPHNVALLEARDASGCTPLLLAAQHGHVETVAFLVHQFQARLDAVDDSGDSATHWAAYKGSAAVLGLLAYYEKQHDSSNHTNTPAVSMLQKPDAYGQTPLHLAALRGHSVACQYILNQIVGPNNGLIQKEEQGRRRRQALALLALPDKNGRTPYELAVHKKKQHTATRLQQTERTLQLLAASSSPTSAGSSVGRLAGNKAAWRLLFQTVVVDWLCSRHRWKTWLGIPTGLDDPMEVAPAFPNYYVFAQVILNVWFHFAVYCPVFDLGHGLLWDCTTLHVLQTTLIVTCIYALYKCQTTNPGRLDDSCPEIDHWRRLYGETLASYAMTTGSSGRSKLQLCHTCHIARPPRSKHDRATGTCVLLFDHNCPFVGNTIGLYNYKWFYLFLLTMTWYFVQHIVLWCKYVGRSDTTTISTGLWILALYLPLHILMTGSLLIYHTQLTLLNLTTNEHLNLQKYDYLWTTSSSTTSSSSSMFGDDPEAADSNGTTDPQPANPRIPSANVLNRKYKNPWYKGFVGNTWDRFNPSHSSYLLPEVGERLLASLSSSSGSSSNTNGPYTGSRHSPYTALSNHSSHASNKTAALSMV